MCIFISEGGSPGGAEADLAAQGVFKCLATKQGTETQPQVFLN